MSAQENKAITRRFWEEVLNKGNLAAADESIATDVIDHDPTPELRWSHGPESVKHWATVIRTAFPDIHVTIEDQIAEGAKVALRLTLSGTHEGNFGDIPPTGKQVTFSAMVIFRIADGKIAKVWPQRDDLRMMQQLGAIPSS